MNDPLQVIDGIVCYDLPSAITAIEQNRSQCIICYNGNTVCTTPMRQGLQRALLANTNLARLILVEVYPQIDLVRIVLEAMFKTNSVFTRVTFGQQFGVHKLIIQTRLDHVSLSVEMEMNSELQRGNCTEVILQFLATHKTLVSLSMRKADLRGRSTISVLTRMLCQNTTLRMLLLTDCECDQATTQAVGLALSDKPRCDPPFFLCGLPDLISVGKLTAEHLQLPFSLLPFERNNESIMNLLSKEAQNAKLLAFGMGMLRRLGEKSLVFTLLTDVFKAIVNVYLDQ
jgi:hypothetical protein